MIEMKVNSCFYAVTVFCTLLLSAPLHSQIGKRFPSERKVVKDPVTGTMLTFLTTSPTGDSKIYQTHNQWTSDGQWLIFRSGRVKGEAMAVNEQTGEMVQVTEGGYTGMLNIARKSMKLYFMRNTGTTAVSGRSVDTAQRRSGDTTGRTTPAAPVQIVEVDLARLFADSRAGIVKPASVYQRVCGTTPAGLGAGGDMALDGAEDWAYFRVGREEAARHLQPGTKLESNFGPRNMGAGPSGIAGMNVNTGEVKYVVSVPFQIGHIQTNPWVPGEIVFCWETGGKSPQRTWTVMSDGKGLRPLYPESEYEWVTHEAVISPDEVAIAIMGHRKISGTAGNAAAATSVYGSNPGQEAAWGPSGTREKPTGLAIINLRTREMTIAAQTPAGSGLWHVSGSPDGRWAVGDDFSRSIYLIDRHTHEMILLSAGHKETAADHPHPTMSPDGTKIQIQSAMLSPDGRSMNICIIPVPETWLKRKYDNKLK
jgi:oligogalacturonide lyase